MNSPIEDMQTSVAAKLVALGDSVVHLFGGRELFSAGTTPRYIWFPTTGNPETNKITTRATDTERDIGTTRETAEIFCHGQSYAAAWAMRCNLLKAVNDLQGCEVHFDKGEWYQSGRDDGWIQDGVAFIVTLSQRVATTDQYTPLATLTPSTAGSVVITAVQLPTYESTKDLTVAGEVLITPP